MTVWLPLTLLSLLAAAALVWPLLRRRKSAPARQDHALEVYRTQLQELERDRDRGLLDDEQAAIARLEVRRRIIAADGAPRQVSHGGAAQSGGGSRPGIPAHRSRLRTL